MIADETNRRSQIGLINVLNKSPNVDLRKNSIETTNSIQDIYCIAVDSFSTYEKLYG